MISMPSASRTGRRCTALVAEEIIPGYQDMISLFEELQLSANHDAGIWRLPNGQQIYIDALQIQHHNDTQR